MRTRVWGLVIVFLCLGAVGCATVPARASNTWLEIDASAFEANVRKLQAVVGPRTRVCAMLKADAYGHGIRLLTPSLVSLGVPCIGIASNEEAQAVRESGFTGQLIRIRAAGHDEAEEALRFDLEELVGNLAFARQLSEVAVRHGRTLRYHLALNSGGMSRNGLELRAPEGKTEALAILRLPGIRIVGIETHFPVEEREEMHRGLAMFLEEADWVMRNGHLDRGTITLHCANSYATLEIPEARLDMVRPGEILFGGTIGGHTEYQRVMQFKSRVASVNVYPAGNTVSYDRTYTLKRESRLANIPVGYSNGYRRQLSNRGFVLIRGRRFPLVGRVTMNTLMVDVTEAPNVREGDEVVLFGSQGSDEIRWTDLEQGSDTIVADLYVGWGSSNPRIAKHAAGTR
jgi:alanine racemase